MELIGDRIVVDLGKAAFLSSNGASEVADMVDRERHIGRGGLPNGFAVVPGFGQREQVEVFLHAIGDLVENNRAFRDAGATPCFPGRMGGVERRLDVAGVRAGHFAKQAAIHR